MQQRRIGDDDVAATLDHPYLTEGDPAEHSVLFYGISGDGRRICVAVTEESAGSRDPVLKTVWEVT